MGGTFDVGAKRARIQELDQLLSSPDFWNDPKAASRSAQESTSIKKSLERFDLLAGKIDDLKVTLELAREAQDAAMESEAVALSEQIESELAAMELERMLSGANDDKGAILSINAGAGGTESCDWAEMLVRMYRMWADRRGYKNEVVDFTEGEQAGFKSATLTIEGSFAFGWLKSEIGVHRLVRISPFDANKRRHTSFASVFVIPDVPEALDILIAESDLRTDTFRSSGAGGQHVNKTDSAVRITHLPTGIAVACRSDRSQHRNRETAMRLLKAKLYEHEMKKRRAETDKLEAAKKDIEWGSQIRSYVLHPYKLVKDHRTAVEIGNAQSVLDGKLDEMMRAYLLSTAGISPK